MATIIDTLRSPFTDSLYWAKRKFKKQRADFYNDLAENMQAQPGTRITIFLTRYAERYPNEPVGKLANHWLDVYMEESSFAQALRGTVPDEDIGALAIAEKAGDLKVGLFTLSRTISGLDATKEAIVSVFAASFIVFIAVQFYVGMYSWKIIPQIESSIPPDMKLEDVGTSAVFLHNMSYIVRHFWPLWLVAIIAVVGVSVWAVPNYIGRFRPWLDRHIIHFSLYREFEAASFLTSLASVTQKINNRVLPVPQALKLMEQDASPWVRWHISRVLVNIEENPQAKGENFNTGMVSKEMQHRMIDVAEYADMADMLDHVGDRILKRTPKEMEKRAQRIQFISRVAMVAVVFALSTAFYKLAFDFQDAVTINAYMR